MDRLERNSQKHNALSAATDLLAEKYLEGNLRVPQSNLAMVSMVGKALLSDTDVTFEEFIDSSFSPDKLKEIKTAMDRAHAAHGIAFMSEERAAEVRASGGEVAEHNIVPDSRFGVLWTDVKAGVVMLAAAALGARGVSEVDDLMIDAGDEGKRKQVIATMLPLQAKFVDQHIDDGQNRERLQKIFNSFRKSLRSDEGQKRSHEWRDRVGYHNIPPPGDEDEQLQRYTEAADLRRELTNILVRDADDTGLTLNDETERLLGKL